MKIFAAAFIACLLPFAPYDAAAKAAAPAQPPEQSLGQIGGQAGIAATVGGDAITSYDVDNRIRFVIATAHLSDTPEVIERIRPQVIRSLIDEKLQMQEATKNDIKIDDKDVNGAIAAIESQRGMPPGTINHILEAGHVPRETFTSQIRAQLAWTKLVGKKLRPDIKISDEEVALAQKKFSEMPPPRAAQSPAQQPGVRIKELKIAVLVLPVDRQSHEADVRKSAEKLVGEVRGGASFEEVSRQFSGSSPKENGKVASFWVALSELDPAIARSLAGAKVGMVSSPIRTEDGYTIVKVYDIRADASAPAPAAPEPDKDQAKDQEVLIKEILLKLKNDANRKEAEILLQIGNDVAKNPGNCEDKGVANIQNLEDFDITVHFRHATLSELPGGLRGIVEHLKPGQSSQPFASNEGIRLFMLCDAKDATGPRVLDPEQVKDELFREKIELAAQKYMRDLRRETYIDVR